MFLVFIYELWEIFQNTSFIAKVLISCTSGKIQACNFIKKETLAQVLSCEFWNFSKNTFFTAQLRATEALEVCEHNFFLRKYKQKVVLFVIYLFNYDSFLYVEYAVWPSLEYSFCQINRNSSFLVIWRLREHHPFCSMFWYVLFIKT